MFFNKELTVFFVHENMKKTAANVAHNRPNFYSVFPTDPKTIKMRDFYIMTLVIGRGVCGSRLRFAEFLLFDVKLPLERRT